MKLFSLYIFAVIFIITYSRCSYDTDFDLGSGYHQYGYGRNSYIFRKNKGTTPAGIIVCGEIISLNLNSDFIVVYRIATPNAKVFFDNTDLWEQQKGVDTNQYWIIDKKDEKVYGPLPKYQYLDLRKKLNVPTSLNVDTIRKD